MIRVLIADDHVLLTESLSMVLQKDGEIEIAATAADGAEAVAKCREYMPDIVLMDIKMPVLNGIEAARQIKEYCPDTKVAFLTSMEDGKSAMHTFLSGADTYLLKDTQPEKLIHMIKGICWGFYVMSGNVRQLFREELLESAGSPAHAEPAASLKVEDIEIIRFISEGKSNNEIGELLGYANGTIKNKITRLLEITGASSRAQLVVYALKSNLI